MVAQTFSLAVLINLCSTLLHANEDPGVLLKQHGIAFDDTSRLLWNQAKTAFAYCYAQTPSKCFIVDTKYATNVSCSESLSLTKIGLYPSEEYEKVYTVPEKWSRSEKYTHLVVFKTHAWRNGQRYTVKQPILVKKGLFLGR